MEVQKDLIDLARLRCCVDAFLSAPAVDPQLRVERATRIEGERIPLVGSPAPWGFLSLEGATLRAEIPEDPYAAESVLRAAFHLLVSRTGGFLAHSSGVELCGQAVIAVGVSGAGKSTLASLLCGAPEARLLSDEIIALFPNGMAYGTPFRSDYRGQGMPDGFPIASIFTLSKGQDERVDEIPLSAGVAAVLSQAYQSPIEPLSRAEILQRVGALVSKVGVRQLTFRKDPAVADFVAQWVREHRPHS